MSAQLERRYVAGDMVEIRADAGEKRRISGHFAVFDKFSPVYGSFREKIAPGFFDEALKNSDVRALFNHDSSKLLGRSTAGTLSLKADSRGLYGEIDPVPNTAVGNDVLENMRLGNLTGASFAFTLPPSGGDAWAKAKDGVWERTLVSAAQLHDVSVVTDPFYPQTDVGVREVRSQLEAAFERWAKDHPEAVQPPKDPAPQLELDRMRMELAGL